MILTGRINQQIGSHRRLSN